MSSRRGFLAGAAVAGAAVATWRLGEAAPVAAAGPERIVVVGAGLAGLTCAYELRKAGYVVEIHEAHPSRLGGRTWSDRQTFAAGQIAEHGGELIDQGHTQIRQLCKSLGLTLDNLLAAEQNGTEPMFWFDGAPYSYVDATNDIKTIWQKIKSDLQAASYPTLYNLSTERGRELDSMSIIDWIEETVPGGMSSRLGQLLDVAYNIEYGAECSEQSSLNLLYLLGYSGQGQLRLFGPSNEKYHVRGGNDQIVSGLAGLLAGQIVTRVGAHQGRPAHRRRVRPHIPPRGSETSPRSPTAWCSHCRSPCCVHSISAAPASTTARFGPSASRAWAPTPSSTCSSSTATGERSAATATRSPTPAIKPRGRSREVRPARPESLWITRAALIGDSFGSGTPQTRAASFADQIEPLFPGISDKLNGRATIDYWPGNQYSLGSYSFWKVGQYQAFAGVERERSGRCHFAGEHTSVDFQGYLNGAVETGQRAAAEILADYK